MHYNCRECTRLWNEYALATRHYLKVDGRLQMAHDSRDHVAVAELSPVVHRAEEERTRLRREIARHESRAAERVDAAPA